MQLEMDRIRSVLSRIVGALFYHETGKIIAADWEKGLVPPIWTYHIADPRVAQDERARHKDELDFTVIAPGVFEYLWYAQPERARLAVFWLVFYDSVHFVVEIAGDTAPAL
jgi:hypothetical protein